MRRRSLKRVPLIWWELLVCSGMQIFTYIVQILYRWSEDKKNHPMIYYHRVIENLL